ncbi:DoxX protein [Fontibacillus panacisegetis]|uniref:DoxX protein n=1 Tax=Fontibacillus panacisegetis TaxID=670482 RepID=A0A1G7VGT4_9BACL|nr:MauE/DoxX family redox-associated membrane protein [Fontibacillus panacisegetis]SDG58907.1 DoxX protein [Fontibacillus panacisegetis]
MTLILFIRIFLATLMICTGLLKIASYKSFKTTVLLLIQRERLGQFGAILIISLEIACGILLFMDKFTVFGNLILVLLNATFIWSVWKASKLNIKVTCNCFGDWIPEELGKSTLFRIIPLLIISITMFLWNDRITMSNLYEIILSILFSISLIGVYAMGKSFKDYYNVESGR